MTEQVTTTKGLIDVSLLARRDGSEENEDQVTEWIEYYLGDELVHRSVHVKLKRIPAGMEGLLGAVG